MIMALNVQGFVEEEHILCEHQTALDSLINATIAVLCE